MRHHKKKLLIATVGLAAVNYACQEKPITTGNLVVPPPQPSASAGPEAMPVGNLMAPSPTDNPALVQDAGTKEPPAKGGDAGLLDHRFRTGNLMPPPPPPPSATKK